MRDRLFFSQKGGFMSLHKYIVFYQEIDDEGDAREDCLEVYAYSRQQAFYLATEYIKEDSITGIECAVHKVCY